MDTSGWVDIIKSIKTPMALVALIVLILGTVLVIPNIEFKIKLIVLAVMIIFLIFIVAWAVKNDALFPVEIKSIWSQSDLPLSDTQRDAWLGKWNCRWTYLDQHGLLKPYVNDMIEIREIDSKTGALSGGGISSYVEGKEYPLRGRVSNKSVTHIFYSSPAETVGLTGMFILKMMPMGEVSGWWIGTGRKGGDVGGDVTMERHEKNPDFKLENFEME